MLYQSITDGGPWNEPSIKKAGGGEGGGGEGGGIDASLEEEEDVLQ
jgi:hypothetical protein